MHNPFAQPQNLWRLEFITEYNNLSFFDLAFEEIALTISSHEISSDTIEAAPNDIWMMQIYFDYEIKHDIIPVDLLKYIKTDSVKIEYVEHKDWSLEPAALQDLKTGKFHIIRDLEYKTDSLIPVLINITRAFGTGDHATTSGCIEAMESFPDRNIKSVLDIGTGSGILAICAKKLWPESYVVGTDIDEIALEVSVKHAAVNEVDIKFQLDLPLEHKFDIIMANILARPLIEMASDIAKLLNNNGVVILSGFLDNQLDSIRAEYQRHNLSPISIETKDRWVTLILS